MDCLQKGRLLMRVTLPRPATLGLVLALVVTLLAAASSLPPDAGAQPRDPSLTRFPGADRIQTAVLISKGVFEEADTVVLARSDDYADALVGVPLAAHLGSPILLTPPGSVPSAVQREIRRLGASEVILLGGPEALEDSVEEDLAEEYEVRRLHGANRFATAAAVAAELPGSPTVFVAEGSNEDPARGFPDPLSAGPYAGFLESPILLVTADRLPSESAAALDRLAPEELVIVGGPVAVSESVAALLGSVTGLDSAAGEVRRLAGTDRYGTSAAVYDEAVAVGMDPAGKWLATGLSFPDALAVGPAVAALGHTLLLVDGSGINRSPQTAARLPVDVDVVRDVRLVGGMEAISKGTERQVAGIYDLALEQPAAEFCLTVLHSNDGGSKLVNAGGRQFGGIARFATLVQQQKELALAEASDGCDERGVLTVTSGDNLLAGLEFSASLENGVPYYDSIALDSIGFDVLGLSNHDFDFGPEVTADFIDGFDRGNEARFVSANLDFTEEPALQELVDDGVIVPSTIVEVGSRQIGVIGLTSPQLSQISSPRGVQVSSSLAASAGEELSAALAGAVQEQVSALEDEGTDAIVLISHLRDLEEDLALVPQLTGVDIVVGGGGREVLAFPGELLVPGDEQAIFGTYPYLGLGPDDMISLEDLQEARDGLPVDADGRFVPVVTTAGDYRYLGRLKTRFGTELDESGTVVDPFFSRTLRVSSTAAPYGVEPDESITDNVVEPVLDHIADLAENVIGTSEVPLDGSNAAIRNAETNLGNLVADAQIAAAKQRAAEFGLDPEANYVSIQNAGGVRNNTVIPAGPVSERTTFDIAPLDNFTSVFQGLDPAELKLLLEHGYSDIGGRRFAQIGGMTIEVEPDAEPPQQDDDGKFVVEGSRVVNVTLDNGTAIVVDGEPVPPSPETEVSVVVGDVLARGGGGYPFPDGEAFTVIGTSYQQALANYITDDLDGTIAAEDYPGGGEGRITFLATGP
ncbi:MAG: hypothetical protein GEU81_06755 [Nitriliruptorales bacterium]|nr:hypothetical protein [Nitriliruptorales bacterium]